MPAKAPDADLEALAVRVKRCLAAGGRREPDDGRIEIAALRGERGVVAWIGLDALEIRLPEVVWIDHAPRLSSRTWRRLPWEGLDLMTLRRAFSEARAERAAEFAPCRFCGQKMPPERRVHGDVCHGCAHRHLGVVH